MPVMLTCMSLRVSILSIGVVGELVSKQQRSTPEKANIALHRVTSHYVALQQANIALLVPLFGPKISKIRSFWGVRKKYDILGHFRAFNDFQE